MPSGRVADLILGGEAYRALVPNGAFNDATYHVGLVPTGTPPFQSTQADTYGLLTGAPTAASGILLSAGKFLALVIDITAITATGTVTVTIFGFDPISGKFWPILVSAALGAVATTRIEVGPGLPVAANVSANDFMPFQWACQVVVGVAQPMTFSIGASYMP